MINKKVNDQKILYKAHDETTHSTYEGLKAANEDFRRRNFQFKGKDGQYYSTNEALDAANRDYNARFNRPIVPIIIDNFPSQPRDHNIDWKLQKIRSY